MAYILLRQHCMTRATYYIEVIMDKCVQVQTQKTLGWIQRKPYLAQSMWIFFKTAWMGKPKMSWRMARSIYCIPLGYSNIKSGGVNAQMHRTRLSSCFKCGCFQPAIYNQKLPSPSMS